MYYMENKDTGEIFSSVGAILSGQVRFDCTGKQKDALNKAITETYGIEKPQLLPISLVNVEVVPVFAGGTLGITSDGEATFPTTVQIGSSVVYNVANGSGKFAQLFANTVAAGGGDGSANPDFALQIYGDAELVGDPWVVEMEADLKQVWNYSRAKFGVEARIGWFDMTADFEKIMQDLQKDGHLKIRYIEGSLDNKNPGLQLFEQGKVLFEALNQQISEGEGLFKMEPNPAPPSPPPDGEGGPVLPWSVSINASYQESVFTQKIHYENRLEYLGRTLRSMPSSIVLAVSCGGDNKRLFFDLTAPNAPCITDAKVKAMQARLRVEKAKQTEVVQDASKALNEKKISLSTYNTVMSYLQNNSLTEDLDTEEGAPLQLGYSRKTMRLKTYRPKRANYRDILNRLELVA
jgi:hypothetical protein